MEKQNIDELSCACREIHPDRLALVQRDLPKEEEMYDLAEVFKVFGDSTRIRILCVLLESEVCVCDLSEALNMTSSAVSHQLKILKNAKLVKSRREGKTVFYAPADDHICTILRMGLEHLRE